jgi:hypothetical protein
MAIEQQFNEWRSFRDFLRKDEHDIFDDMMNQARMNAAAASALAPTTKTEGVFLSILFAHHKTLMRIMRMLEELKKDH